MPVGSISRRLLVGGSLCSTMALPLGARTYAAGTPFVGTLDAARLRQAVSATDALAQSLHASSGIPGIAVAIVHGEELLFSKGYGVRKVGEAGAVDPDTVFQLASVSKPLGATVVAQQVGLRRIAWDSRIQNLLPWFTLSDATATRELTVADLYAHRSGLPDHAGDILEELGYVRNEILHRLRLVPIDGFRKKYHYTNMGITAAAQAVAKKAGTDWSSLSETVLYRPLGMSRTTSRFAAFMAMNNRAVGHVPVSGRFLPGPVRDPDVQSPAGGASASVEDMAKWLSLILGMGRYRGQEILARATLAPALSPQIQIAPPQDGKPASYYGFGFNVGTSYGGHRMLSHSGAFLLGAATSVMMLPEFGVGIVVLTNAWPVGAAEAIGLTFLDYIQFGVAQKDWMAMVAPLFAQMTTAEGDLVGKMPPVPAAPPKALSAYTGSYNNAYYGPLTVTEAEGALTLSAGPARIQLPCSHWDGDVFAIHPANESAPPGSVYKVDFSGTPPWQMTSAFFAESQFNLFTRSPIKRQLPAVFR